MFKNDLGLNSTPEVSAILDGFAHASCNIQTGKAGVSIDILERANEGSLTCDTIT